MSFFVSLFLDGGIFKTGMMEPKDIRELLAKADARLFKSPTVEVPVWRIMDKRTRVVMGVIVKSRWSVN
jgi:hypothetical protein